MSDSSIIALVILILSVILLVLEAIAEAGVISLSRSRAQLLASRAPDNPRAVRLTEITADRERALGSFAVGRTVAVGAGFTSVFYIVIHESGFSWEAVVITGGVGAFVAAMIQSVPRRLAATWPEAFALFFVPAIDLLDAAFLVPAAILEAPSRLVTGLGRRHTELAAQPTDLEVLLERDPDPIEDEERQMIRGVMSIGDRVVREAMTPRPDIAALPGDTPLADAAAFILKHGFSRVPVYTQSIDNITGILYAKDVMGAILTHDQTDDPIAPVCREPMLVPESRLIDDLLTDFRRRRVHMAVVLDEYGGTAGLVTLEDLIEEIVGEIADEYDHDDDEAVARFDGDALLIDGRAPLTVLEQIGGRVEAADFDTVAGLVFDRLGRIPTVGDQVRVDTITVTVEKMEGRRVAAMRAAAVAAPSPTDGADRDSSAAAP